jgi:hypothetical protein
MNGGRYPDHEFLVEENGMYWPTLTFREDQIVASIRSLKLEKIIRAVQVAAATSFAWNGRERCCVESPSSLRVRIAPTECDSLAAQLAFNSVVSCHRLYSSVQSIMPNAFTRGRGDNQGRD